MKYSKILASSLVAVAAASAITGMIGQQLSGPMQTSQETVIGSSTKVVVVVIPGFPLESLVIGMLVGVAVLAINRRRKCAKLVENESTL